MNTDENRSNNFFKSFKTLIFHSSQSLKFDFKMAFFLRSSVLKFGLKSNYSRKFASKAYNSIILNNFN